MSLHPLLAPEQDQPPSWQLVSASLRLPAQEGLAQFKTCNKLPQILARAEAEAAGAHEALLLNTDGFVVEAASSNLFWIDRGAVCTPPLASGILAGVTRAVVSELCGQLGLGVREENITSAGLIQADGVFLSLSSIGIAEGVALDQREIRRSPVTQQLHQAYTALLLAETKPGT
jgi:branched-subunit amino acid aminotransferase/4-amino-4-deoxychorismate lyase